MFHTEGEQRSDRHNQLLAGYLATVAGLVNSAGFILAGSFTSHVTGNVGRLADNLALGHGSAAALAATMIGATSSAPSSPAWRSRATCCGAGRTSTACSSSVKRRSWVASSCSPA